MAGYIATAQSEDTISFYGESDSPENALAEFLKGTAFKDHCESVDASAGDEISVGIFKAIYNGDPDWDDELYESEWRWVLGERVDTKRITVTVNGKG